MVPPSHADQASRVHPFATRIVYHSAISMRAAPMHRDPADTTSWLQSELEDDFDEELEQEIDDARVPPELRKLLSAQKKNALDRGFYFRELLRLQGELIK